MADEITVRFNCRNCGEAVTWPEDAADDYVVSCKSCGTEIGPLGEIKAAGFRAAKDSVNDMIENAIKGIPGIKFEKKF